MVKDSGELPIFYLFYLGSHLIKSKDLRISPLCDGVPAMNRWRSSNASASRREDVPKALPLERECVSEREEKVSLAGKIQLRDGIWLKQGRDE